MSDQQRLLTDYLSPQQIEALALPANLRYGRTIFDRGGVEFISLDQARVEGWAGGLSGCSADGGGQRRRVELVVTTEGLTWHCTGNPKHHQIFCKHCVALALAIWHRHGERS